MLILSRKFDEKIRIGDDIVITIVHCGGDKVRVGIEAPKHIPVHREEVWKLIQEQGEEPPPLAFDPTWPVLHEPSSNRQPASADPH